MVVSMTMAFYELKMHKCMELIQMKKLKNLSVNTFHVIYRYYQLHYKMHNNINTLEHVRKEIMLSIDSIIPCLP